MTSFLLVVLYRRGLRAGAVVVVMFFSSAKLRLILKVEEQKGRKSGRNGRTDAKNDATGKSKPRGFSFSYKDMTSHVLQCYTNILPVTINKNVLPLRGRTFRYQ